MALSSHTDNHSVKLSGIIPASGAFDIKDPIKDSLPEINNKLTTHEITTLLNNLIAHVDGRIRDIAQMTFRAKEADRLFAKAPNGNGPKAPNSNDRTP